MAVLLIELAAAVYLFSVLRPHLKRLTVPQWLHNIALVAFVLVILLAGFTALFNVR